LAALLVLAGCARSAHRVAASHPSAIVVGVLTSGTGSGFGRDAVRGAQLAAEVVNDDHPELALPLGPGRGVAGGIPISVSIADTKGEAATAQTEAGRLYREAHAVGLVAADSTTIVAALSQQTERYPLPLVDAYTSADRLTESGLEWYFRTGPSDGMLARTTFGLLRQQQGDDMGTAHRLGLLQGSSTPDAATLSTVDQLAGEDGYQIVARLPIGGPGSATDLSDKLGQAHPDVVLAVISTDQEAAVVADLAPRLRSVPVLALGHGLTGLAAGPAGTRVLRTVGWSDDYATRNPVTRAVAKMYQDKFGGPMTDAAANAFTATLTLAMAIDGSGAGEARRVRETLRDLWIPATKTIMPWDGIRFDASGQNEMAGGVVEQRGPAGFQVVFPRELATVPLAWRGH
jgi:branched-chain amino acid transport system substrate-binding protein